MPESSIVAMSVCTTQSATAVLEKIRAQIKATTPSAADFSLVPANAAPTISRCRR